MDTISRKIIAIDFDGTITEPSTYPITGKIRQDAIDVIKRLQKRYLCCLWTCRKGDDLQEAIQLLKDNGVVFKYVNSTPFPERSSNKIYADIYIDDKAFNTSIDWQLIEKTLLEEYNE